MSHHPTPHFTPQPPAGPFGQPLARPLPRRGTGGTQQPAIPSAALAATGPDLPRAQQVPQVPVPSELARRYALLEHLGVPLTADEVFDEMATDLAHRTGFLYGFVNFGLREQTFVGLHQPPADSGHVIVGRTMRPDQGWCPEVMARRKALPLPDVHASPRFSGNEVAYAVGIRAYFGAPLIHQDSGIVLGTVCVIDPERRPLSTARRLRDIVISSGERVMDHIVRAPLR